MKQSKIQAEIEELNKKYPNIAKMTVADVVALDSFDKHLQNVVDTYKTNTISYYAFKSLHKNDILKVENFKKEYISCLDKHSKLPTIKRAIIIDIGHKAYRKTVLELTEQQDKLNTTIE